MTAPHASSELVTSALEGKLFDSKYRVERFLSAGAMGVVLGARHLLLDEPVAIKVLIPDLVGNPDVVARFVREARVAVKLKGEHVARVFDVGTLPSGAPYIVMELLDGTDLSVWLEEHGPLSVELAVDFVLQACVAVAEAHALGVFHCDLKPSNLFCVRGADGRITIKVLDFGISKVVSFNTLAGRAAHEVSGSPAYMSPEQTWSRTEVDARTDVWALGVVLFELLTRRMPFEADTLALLLRQIGEQEPARLRDIRPDVPIALERIVLTCLQKDPSMRYRNVAALAAALRAHAPPQAAPWIGRTVEFDAGASESSAPPVALASLEPQRLPAAGASAIAAEPHGHVTWAGAGLGAAVLIGVLAMATRFGPNPAQAGRPTAQPAEIPAVADTLEKNPVLAPAEPAPVKLAPIAAPLTLNGASNSGVGDAAPQPQGAPSLASPVGAGATKTDGVAPTRPPLSPRAGNERGRVQAAGAMPSAQPAAPRASVRPTPSTDDALFGLKPK